MPVVVLFLLCLLSDAFAERRGLALVVPGIFLLAQCSLRWSVWTRRTVLLGGTLGALVVIGMFMAGFAGFVASHAVFPHLSAGPAWVLYVAEECTKIWIFWEFTSGVVSAFSACWLDSGYIYGVSLRVLRSYLARGHYFLAPCTWHLLVASRRLKSTRRGFSVRFFQKCSGFLHCLARQWIHVCVSIRVCGRLCLATETGTHSANCACSFFGPWWLCNTWFDSGYMYGVSSGLHVPSGNGACEAWRVTPAIGAGKGWRGRRESDSQVTCHLN